MSVWMKGCVEMDIRKVVVISDTHKDYASLQKIVDRHRQEASLFIFLGDVEQDVRTLLKLYPDLRHEILNETCREQVYEDIFNWLGTKTAVTLPL